MFLPLYSVCDKNGNFIIIWQCCFLNILPYPWPREANELEELSDPGRQQGHGQVKCPHAELDPALEMWPELIILLWPVPVLQNLPTGSER